MCRQSCDTFHSAVAVLICSIIVTTLQPSAELVQPEPYLVTIKAALEWLYLQFNLHNNNLQFKLIILDCIILSNILSKC